MMHEALASAAAIIGLVLVALVGCAVAAIIEAIVLRMGGVGRD